MLRAALYWTPDPSDPLAEAGASWLGRDAETGATPLQPPIPGLAALTADPRRYGFHATLRPPMRLATGWSEFCAAAERVAGRHRPFTLAPLAVAMQDGFLALHLTEPCPPLQALADDCVEETNRHRLPPSPTEIARRTRMPLTEAERRNLDRFGYPWVLDTWRFHVTLTQRLGEEDATRLFPAAQSHFAYALARPRQVTALSICTQAREDPSVPFLVAERIVLG